MTDIPMVGWAADKATFEKQMVALGVAPHGVEAARDLQVAGAGYCGWSGKRPDRSSPLDEDGAYTKMLPGVFFSIKALDRTHHDGKTKSLARMLRHHPVTDEKYQQTETLKDGSVVQKHLLDRTCLEYGVTANGGQRTATVGTKDDPKAPPRVEVLDKAGEVIFWLGCPSDISEPFNGWG